MGADLFDRFADWTSQADAILGYSIRALCVDDPKGELGSTEFTQPALFVVNAMTFRARQEDGAAPPAWVAGHSLGEYNALLAADVFDFSTGLKLVQRRGQLMGHVRGGGMSAVIGLEPAKIQGVLAASPDGQRLDVANFNSFEQTVIAGPTDSLAAVKASLQEAGGRVIPLNVSAPFHSRYMRDSQAEFESFLRSFELRPPSIPVIANATAAPYATDALHETLGRQIGNSVRWLDSMLFLLDQGVTDVEEMGPGKVLSKLFAQIQKRRS